MRCNNCGWENPDSNSKCEKCGTPLNGGQQHRVEPIATNVVADNLKSTVFEADVFGELKSPIVSSENECPKCGYPLRQGSMVCPNCKYEVQNKKMEEKQNIMSKQNLNVVGSGTINPWINVPTKRQCKLTPITAPTEDKLEAISFKEGEIHNLNRANLESENPTITSQCQAQLSCDENGNWHIEDHSTQKTTFIHVNEKTQLKDGDIILMGNRQFVFNVEK